MFNFKHVIVVMLCCYTLVGCVSPKSFVDPSVSKLTYSDVTKRAEPIKMKLTVEFQRNGEHLPKVDATLKENTAQILKNTGVIAPVNETVGSEINVTVNNIADMAEARKKGIGTGLTFGLAGTTVMDAYEMKISITSNGKTVTRTAIKHALYTAIGNTTLPQGVEILSPKIAFERVLEQMILRALHDMQQAGELSQMYIPMALPWGWVAQS